MMEGMDELSRAHLQHLIDERVPENTIKGRRRVLGLVGIAGTATREDVETWWSTRADLSKATRANDLSHLRAFYKWAQRWGHRADDPTLRIDAPNVPNGLPRPMSRADLLKLLQDLDPDMRRTVCLGAYAGLRVSESATLDWSNVDIEARRIRIINSKGGKSRVVAISPLLLDDLLPETGGNVVAGGGKPYTPAQLERKVNRAIERAGIEGTSHQLRHRYGTLAYQATGDLIAVGRQMGHSSPVTTAVYAAASDEVADKIAQAVIR